MNEQEGSERVQDLTSLINSVKDTSDLYYLSLMISSTQISNSILPELIFLLKEEAFQNLLTYYGGQTITIPTLQEFRNYLYGILIYYYYDMKHMSWNEALSKIDPDYTNELSVKLSSIRRQIIDGLRGIKIPEIKSGDTK